MTLISENTIILLLIVITTVLLITYFSFSYQKLKNVETTRLQSIFLEIEVEKNNSQNLKNTSAKIDALERKTNLFFRTINVEIFNIDFSYKEVLSKM